MRSTTRATSAAESRAPGAAGLRAAGCVPGCSGSGDGRPSGLLPRLTGRVVKGVGWTGDDRTARLRRPRPGSAAGPGAPSAVRRTELHGSLGRSVPPVRWPLRPVRSVTIEPRPTTTDSEQDSDEHGLLTGPRCPSARDPQPAGALPAGRGGQVAGPLEGRRRRLLRAGRPRGHRAAARPSSPCSTACRSPSCCPTRGRAPRSRRRTKIVLNLESLGSLPADEAGPLARYASTIQAQRDDYNGKVLSIRAEDLRSLAIIYDMSPDELTARLIEWGVLSPGMESVVGIRWRRRGRRGARTRAGSAAAALAERRRPVTGRSRRDHRSRCRSHGRTRPTRAASIR